MAKRTDKVDQKRLWAFQSQLAKLCKKKFCDDDGDSLVEVILVDRSRFHSNQYSPVPYWGDAPTLEEQDAYLRAISINMSLAQDDVKCYLSHVSDRLFKQRHQADRAAAAKKSKLRLCWVPECSTCGRVKYDEPIVDLMGFIHYGIKVPTTVPEARDRMRGVFKFMLSGNYQVSWIPEPIKMKDDDEPRLPCGEIAHAGKSISWYRYDKDKPEWERLTFERLNRLPPYLIPLLEAEISRPWIEVK